MNISEQGAREPGGHRHQVIPRTLIFVTSRNPQTGAQEVLLLRGAPDKRLWANRYNGLGGHVEASEDVLAAARRELQEEAGLAPRHLALRGVIHINTGADHQGPRPGIVVFVFQAESESRVVTAAAEGAPEWIPVDLLAECRLVDDLYEIIPRVLSDGPVFYGHYSPSPDGTLQYRFTS
jgi:8-oxo-dGTP diphosphatase